MRLLALAALGIVSWPASGGPPAASLPSPGPTAEIGNIEANASRRPGPGCLRLEITTWGTGWHLLQNLRVRPGATGYVPGSTREN